MKKQQKYIDTLSEKYLLETAFAKDGSIFVMHDDGHLICDTIDVKKYDLVCKQNSTTTCVNKIVCILAVPVAKLEYLKQHIKESQKLRALNLRGTQQIADRHPTASTEACKRDQTYRFALRNGTWFDGIFIGGRRYHILVRAGGEKGKIVFVYKHAIYAIKPTES